MSCVHTTSKQTVRSLLLCLFVRRTTVLLNTTSCGVLFSALRPHQKRFQRTNYSKKRATGREGGSPEGRDTFLAHTAALLV